MATPIGVASVLLAAVAAQWACGDADAPLRTTTRFVDPAERVGIESAPPEMQLERPGLHAWEAVDPLRPTATIGGETRPVLAAIERGPRSFERGVAPDADGRLSVPIPSGGLTVSGPFVVVVRVRDADTPTAPSRALPGWLVPAGTERIGVDLPEALRAPRLDVYVETLRPPSGRETVYETAEVELRPATRIEVAMGVLGPAVHTGRVDFSVSLCGEDACHALGHELAEPGDGVGEAWRDRVFDSGSTDVRRGRLRFAASWAGAFSMPVFGDPRLVEPEPGAPELPSIILLSVDTLRADHLGVYGYPRETAPFLTGVLAEGGVVFDTLVSAATTTGPSHMTMFTSLPPSVHRVAGSHRAMATAVPTLAALLRDAGYETAAVTDDGALDHERGFALGFDRFYENKSARAMETGQIEQTFDRGLDYVESRGERPFFLFLHTFQVHDPYTPPPRYAKLFAGDRLAPAPGLPERARWARGLMADYDREIRYVDDELAAFVTALEARGFFERGLLVVTSDHGEAFLEHGLQGHGGLPHEELLHAPLVFFGRGVTRGVRVAEPVTHADLMPTLLDIAGVAAPQHGVGRSFAALLRGGRAPGERDEPIVSEAWGRFVGARMPALSARLGRFKMIRAEGAKGPEYVLYDLEADPRERTNLEQAPSTTAGDELSRARPRLRAVLDGHAQEAAELQKRLGAGIDEAPLPIDPDREAKLRALGYIE